MLSSNNFDVYIVGAGETKFGELWERSLRELAVEAGLRAVENAGVYSRDVQVLYGSNSLAGIINGQENIGALLSDFSGIAENNIPAIRIEASTASGGAAVRQAYLAVKSGEYGLMFSLSVAFIVYGMINYIRYILQYIPFSSAIISIFT